RGTADKDLLNVEPLLTTRWDQPYPYNGLCPQDPFSGQRAVVGCVATAMAQVMRYHAHPAQGAGFHSYNHPQFGTVSANFGATTYNWANMPNVVTNFNQDVALLSYHCGVSIEMEYGVDVSGVSSLSFVADALKQYFAYANTTTFVERNNFSTTTWIQMMKEELDNSRPVQYAGVGQAGGHSWVMDGYDTGNFFHMNWGWGGYQDGYFTIDNLNPDLGGTGAGSGGFNYYQQAVIGIAPATGGGGSGTPDPEAYSNLVVYSGVTADPYPIQFAQAFQVDVDIANLGSEPVTGDIAAAIFTQDGTFLDFIDTQSGTLDNGFFYSLSFTNEGLPTSPGTYQMAFFFRPTGGEYTLIPPGDYANPLNFEIEGPDNDITLYSTIQPNPAVLTVNEPFTITIDYANFGFSNYSGEFSADLYTLEGDYVAELDVISSDLCSNCHFTGGLTFSSDGVDVEPGTYLIATWNRPQGGNWQIVATGEYENPIRVQFQAPAIVADPYENNNSLGAPYTLNPGWAGNAFTFSTNGANMHQADDEDYFRVDLPAGFQYTITARVHDSYNSGNGQTYTNDVLFGLYDGSNWSDLYDTDMDAPLVLNGGQSVTIGVSSYFVGTLGTYALDLSITRSPGTSVPWYDDTLDLTLSPNPSSGPVWLQLELPEAATLRADLLNISGQRLRRYNFGTARTFREQLDLSELTNGAYLLQLDIGGYLHQRRLILAR
ncbi:MAG: C10 family peptidase, partial [Lewinella sp.]|nr:C10 family peptidase [Lewinella sp.]